MTIERNVPFFERTKLPNGRRPTRQISTEEEKILDGKVSIYYTDVQTLMMLQVGTFGSMGRTENLDERACVLLFMNSQAPYNAILRGGYFG